MKSNKVALCDKDERYICSLMNYINGDKESPIVMLAFTDLEKLIKYLENNTVDLIILTDELQMPNSRIKVIYLTENEKNNKTHTYLKYQSGVVISNIILDELKRISNIEKNSSVIFSGVYSPFGRSGKTKFALSYCKLFSDDAIYLGMEDYNSLEINNSTMENVIYYIKQRKGEIISYIYENASLEYGMPVIPSCQTYLDIKALDASDIKWLHDQFIEAAKSKRVMIEIGSACLYDISILVCFDRIYIPTLKNEECQNKLKNFYSILEKKQLINVKESIVEIDVSLFNIFSEEINKYIYEIEDRMWKE